MPRTSVLKAVLKSEAVSSEPGQGGSPAAQPLSSPGARPLVRDSWELGFLSAEFENHWTVQGKAALSCDLRGCAAGLPGGGQANRRLTEPKTCLSGIFKRGLVIKGSSPFTVPVLFS